MLYDIEDAIAAEKLRFLMKEFPTLRWYCHLANDDKNKHPHHTLRRCCMLTKACMQPAKKGLACITNHNAKLFVKFRRTRCNI